MPRRASYYNNATIEDIPQYIKNYVGFIKRFRLFIIFFWLIISGISLYFAPKLLTATSTQVIPPPNSLSADADALTQEKFPASAVSTSIVVYLESNNGETLTCPTLPTAYAFIIFNKTSTEFALPLKYISPTFNETAKGANKTAFTDLGNKITSILTSLSASVQNTNYTDFQTIYNQPSKQDVYYGCVKQFLPPTFPLCTSNHVKEIYDASTLLSGQATTVLYTPQAEISPESAAGKQWFKDMKAAVEILSVSTSYDIGVAEYYDALPSGTVLPPTLPPPAPIVGCGIAKNFSDSVEAYMKSDELKTKYGSTFLSSYQSYYSLQEQKFPESQYSILGASNGESILMVSMLNCDFSDVRSVEFANDVTAYMNQQIDTNKYKAAVTGIPVFLDVILAGVKKDAELMDGIVLPIALCVLGAILKSFRLLVIPLCCVAVAALTSLALVYFLAETEPVITFAPSLMQSLLIAMSIDYSLFLLSRYREELIKAAPSEFAIQSMLANAGHVITVSGLTLIVAFASFIFFPINILSSSGAACSIALGLTLIVNLTLTPSLLFQFASFFEKCVAPPPVIFEEGGEYDLLGGEQSSTLTKAEINLGLEDGYEKSFWFRLASLLIRPWVGILVILATMGMIIPFALHATTIPLDAGVTAQLLPRGSSATATFNNLVNNIGSGFIFPYHILIENKTAPEFLLAPKTEGEIFNTGYDSFSHTATKVDAVINEILASVPLVKKSDFQSVYTQDDLTLKFFYGCNKGFISATTSQCLVSKLTYDQVVSRDGTTTQILLFPTFNPANHEGIDWLASMRTTLDQQMQQTGYRIVIGGTSADTIDASNKTYSLFLPMIIVTCSVVFLMLACAFRSLFIPLRSVFTIGLTLSWIYGFSSMVYAGSAFNSWGFGGFETTGNFYWLIPVFSFTIIVGLGVDYDVFLLGRIVEARDAGFGNNDSIVIGAYSTGHIITAAGMIMAIAFSGLLFSSIPALNQLSFFLVFSVLFDTFIVRTLMAPSIMALLGEINYWPRGVPVVREYLSGVKK